MPANRRDVFKLALSGAAAYGLGATPARAALSAPASFVLDNGLRVHLVETGSGIASATLLLRSDKIVAANGNLGHLTEHTSFCGAAGLLSAQEVKDRQRAMIQDSNASTSCGAIQWDASFLPKYTADVLGLLAVTSLDQKFDTDSVAKQAQVVLEELYLDKYDAAERHEKEFDRCLYGKDHPYGAETTDIEIKKAKTPPETLAAELRRYAAAIRLPANMDLVLVGEFDRTTAVAAVHEHFGVFPFAAGPALALPAVNLTRGYKPIAGSTGEFQEPLSKIKIAWNTGACLHDADARVLTGLRQLVENTLFDTLRDENGETYTPEVDYEPDECSGVFTICMKSSKSSAHVEKAALELLGRLRTSLDRRHIDRLRDQIEFKRKRDGHTNETQVTRMVERIRCGTAVDDLAVDTIRLDEMRTAAEKYLPAHKGGYVRLTLKGE